MVSAPIPNPTPQTCTHCGAGWNGGSNSCPECGTVQTRSRASPARPRTNVRLLLNTGWIDWVIGVLASAVRPPGSTGQPLWIPAVILISFGALVSGEFLYFGGGRRKTD